MKSSVLLVVASIHLGGSYYNQTSLSSVLSTFEAQLTVPRQKEAEQTAPVSTAVPAPAAASLLHADDTSKDMPSDATLTPADATLTPADVTSVDTSSAAIQVHEEFSAESASAAVTKMLAEISTVSTEPAVTKGTTKVSATSNPTFLSNSIGEESPTSSEGLPQEREVGLVEDTVPRAALPSHVVANSGSSRVWTYKEVSLVAHVSQVMWLTVLTGISAYFFGANAHLWLAVHNLRRARA